MIFGRKARRATEPQDVALDEGLDAAAEDVDEDLEDAAGEPLDEDEDADGADEPEPSGDADHRADGPFDIAEVDLDADHVQRLAFGPLVVTPFEGLNVQLHGDDQSGTIFAMLAMYENSGLELALFAAPTSGGLAQELREDTIEEAEQAGGSAEVADGPFGPEVRRVLPLEGPEGEQLFHVSRIWLVEGPRWLLRGTLMGPAGMTEGEAAPADVFIEFFRNVVVQRDDAPRVPGELITLAVPDNSHG